MDAHLKELINLATETGSISEEHENMIIQKALEQGMTETEIRLFIDSALKKSKKSESEKSNTISYNHPDEKKTTNEWIAKDSLKTNDIIVLIASVLAMISGFFPWIGAKSSASFGGYGGSWGASSSIGFVYTLPVGIAAIIFSMRSALVKHRVFFGIGIILLSFGFIASYTTKYSYGGFGGNASASTSAGAGVYILLVSGVLYLLGSLIKDTNQDGLSAVLKKLFRTILIAIGLLFITIPISIWLTNYDSSSYFKDYDFIIPLIPIALLFGFSKVQFFSFIKPPMKVFFLLLALDILLRSFSFFPSTNSSENLSLALAKDTISQEARNILDQRIQFESIKDSYNQNWFATRSNGEPSNLFFSLVQNIITLSLPLLTRLLIYFIFWSFLLYFIMIEFDSAPLRKIWKQSRDFVIQKVGNKWESRGSILNYLLFQITKVLIILISIKLLFAFTLNATNYYNADSEIKKRYSDIQTQAKAIQDSLIADAAIKGQFNHSMTSLNNRILSYYLPENEMIDSNFIVLLCTRENYSDASSVSDSLKAYGFHSNYRQIPREQSGGNDTYAVIVGSFPNRINCNKAAQILKEKYPSAKPYLLTSENIFMSLDELQAQSTAQSTALYMINDPDGFTNLRSSPDGDIIRQVTPDERFTIINTISQYKFVQFSDGTQGYIHESRVVPADTENP